MPRRPPPTPTKRWQQGQSRTDVERFLVVYGGLLAKIRTDHDVTRLRTRHRPDGRLALHLEFQDGTRQRILFECPRSWIPIGGLIRLPAGRAISPRERLQLTLGVWWWYDVEVRNRDQAALAREPFPQLYALMADVPARSDRKKWEAYAPVLVSRMIAQVRDVLAMVKTQVVATVTDR